MTLSKTLQRLRPLTAASSALFLLTCLPVALRAQAPSTPPAQAAPAAPAQAAPAPAPNWQSYSYPAEGFSAVFPFAPQFQKQNVPTDAGSFELRSYLVEVGSSAVYVGICDYGTAVQGKSPDDVLSGAQAGALTNIKGHLISSSKITLGVYPGLTLEAENDSMHFSARIYLVGSTLYQTLVAAPLSQPFPDVQRFLDSFQLIARTQN
jgi:hypothetical protein